MMKQRLAIALLAALAAPAMIYPVFLMKILCFALFACAFNLLIGFTGLLSFGQVLKAVKENEPRAVSLGYDSKRYKLLAFVLSAALAGLAGATKTVVLGFETLTDVHWTMSGLVVLMTLVGGLGTPAGPIVGALVIVALENRLGDVGSWLAEATHIEAFNAIGESVTIVIGFIFIVCVLAFRRGIVGEILMLRGRTR